MKQTEVKTHIHHTLNFLSGYDDLTLLKKNTSKVLGLNNSGDDSMISALLTFWSRSLLTAVVLSPVLQGEDA